MRNDLIRRAAVMESLVTEYNRKRTGDGLKLAWIEKAVDDVKPVVTCKDCARYGREDCFMKIQMIWELRPWDFCSYAEGKA